MADFTEIFIGKDEPLSVEKIMTLMNNDRYNYEKAVAAPRGILAYKTSTASINISATSWTQVGSLTFDFTCESNRMLEFGLCYPYATIGAGAGADKILFQFAVDSNQATGIISAEYAAASTQHCIGIKTLTDSVDAGTHTLTLNALILNGTWTATLVAAATYPIILYVADLGQATGVVASV